MSLVDKQFGSKAENIYCGPCYDAQFATRCDGCGEIFRAGEFGGSREVTDDQGDHGGTRTSKGITGGHGSPRGSFRGARDVSEPRPGRESVSGLGLASGWKAQRMVCGEQLLRLGFVTRRLDHGMGRDQGQVENGW